MATIANHGNYTLYLKPVTLESFILCLQDKITVYVGNLKEFLQFILKLQYY